MERFRVVYRIEAADLSEAEARAEAVALEDTVEVPRDVVPAGYIADVVCGRVEGMSGLDDGVWRAEISYHIDAVGREFAQFLNVLLGNASILKGVKAVELTPNADLLERFPGARFGAAGLRRLIGRARGGYVCPVLKPQGSATETLADLAYAVARAGADIVKEDHGLFNQDAAPFRERVPRIADAVARANAERAAAGDSARALYFATVGAHGDAFRDAAHFAKEAGADGLLILPGLLGFDALNRLAQEPGLDLPLMAHPSHLGPYVLSADTGYAHALLFGGLMRLAGADISVFPNYGGRFGFSRAECESIAAACRDPSGPSAPILPSPGGGMSVERLPEIKALYGDDCVYLLGGGLLRYGDRIGEGVRAMRSALSS